MPGNDHARIFGFIAGAYEIDGTDTDARRMRRWCAERVSREKVPVKWFVLDEFPKPTAAS